MNDIKDYEIEIMLSKHLQGKAPEWWGPLDWRHFYRTFKLTKLTTYTLAAMVWQGFSFTPPYGGGRRIEENFTGAHHIAFDFDSDGADLDYLMRPESLSWTFGAFAYSTPSSTENHPKSRVVFVLMEPITDPAVFRLLYQAMAAEFEREGSRTDPACKDSLRLYFGSPNCRVATNWSLLTPETVDFFIGRYEGEHPPAPPPLPDPTAVSVPASGDYIERRVNALLDKVIHAPDGEKHTTLNKVAYTIGGYVGAGHISQGEAVGRVEAAIIANGRADDMRAARQTIEEAVVKGAAAPIFLDTTYKADLGDLL